MVGGRHTYPYGGTHTRTEAHPYGGTPTLKSTLLQSEVGPTVHVYDRISHPRESLQTRVIVETVVPSSCCCRAQRKVETAEVASTPRADAISCLCSIPLRPCHYWTRQRAVTSEAQLRGALEGARKERDTALLAADGAQTAAKTSSREVSELHALLENEVGAHLCAVLNGWDAHVPSCSIVFHRVPSMHSANRRQVPHPDIAIAVLRVE